MDRIIECVPNFSTSDPKVIGEIGHAIKQVGGIKLLNVEPDLAYNRVVVTFVGSKENIGEAAFQAISKATELIDMAGHKGEHPRMGACDVTPFIPVRGVSVEECVEIAKSVAKRVAEELGVPTYLYGSAAASEERKVLSNIRKGQYEGLAEKIVQPEWAPDYGKAKFNAKSGAYVLGVRDFLLAYNVNVDQEEVTIAKEVAELVRESGKLVKKDGEKVRIPGLLKGVQGMGFPLERDGRKLTQVSMNILDFRNKAKLHEAFEEVKRLTEERGANVTGSEIVGLVPLDAILEAGKFYDPKESDQNALIQLAVEKLGLSDLDEFMPSQKIVELIIEEERLIELTVDQFLSSVGSEKPAPGGGSVSALAGALAGNLGMMVANLTIGKKNYENVSDEISGIRGKLMGLEEKLRDLVDNDTVAFKNLMNAYRIPKDKDFRALKIQKATKYATHIPLETAKTSMEVLALLQGLAEKGNKNAITDVGVAALLAKTAIEGALLNVKINLGSIKDEDYKKLVSEDIIILGERATALCENIMLEVNKGLP